MKLKYGFSILLSLIGLMLIGAGAIYGALHFKNLSTFGFVLIGGLIVIGLLFMFISKPMRQNSRQEMQTDKYGNRNKGYSQMSKKERDYIDLLTTAQDEQILSEAEWRSMNKKGSDNPKEVLNSLIGLHEVKQKVSELEAQMNYLPKNERKAFHMCFLGRPGTGKTTISSILTGFLYQNKFIKQNKYIYTDASNIVACGNAARKMKLILQRCHGSVLFIDEAYCFAYNNQGYEALTLLLNEMENSRNDLIVIMAGYKKEMKSLFALNSGLQSRINTYLFFEDYDQNEMVDIIKYIAKQENFEISSLAIDKLVNIFIWQKCLPSFANARTVRKIFENAKSRHYYNLSAGIISKEYKNCILPEDIIENIKEDNYFSK